MLPFDPLLSEMSAWEKEDIANLMCSIERASIKHQELKSQRTEIDREAAVYREALFGLGEILERRLRSLVPLVGHLVEARNGQKFIVEKVLLGPDRLNIRKDAVERIVVWGPNLTTRGKKSTGGWMSQEYLSAVTDHGPFVEKVKRNAKA